MWKVVSISLWAWLYFYDSTVVWCSLEKVTLRNLPDVPIILQMHAAFIHWWTDLLSEVT